MRRILVLSALAALGGCVAPPRVAPPPIVRPAPAPTPTPAAALGPDWNDWPRTPGDWRYLAAGTTSSAVHGTGQVSDVVLTCDRARRVVSLAVPADIAAPLTVRTSSATRTLATVLRSAPGTIPSATTQADLAATDPLLDAIAFSRGRFTVERAGTPPLVLPPYAEIGRVIEDCRR